MGFSLCPFCRRHVRAADRCPFCAAVLAGVCAAVVVGCGRGQQRTPTVYGGPPDHVVSWQKTLDHDQPGLLAQYAAQGLAYGCTVMKREKDAVFLNCPEANIALMKNALEVTVACNKITEDACRALLGRIGDAKLPDPAPPAAPSTTP